MNIWNRIISIILLIVLLLFAIYSPYVYFKISDHFDGSKQRTLERKTNEKLEEFSSDDNIRLIVELLENSSAINMLALQKKEMSDIEQNKLSKELNQLVKVGLIKAISVDHIKEHLVYVAYYNMFVPSDESVTMTLKEFKFTDYNSFEYSFWMDGETDKIYEVTLVDENIDFSLSELDYMNGMHEYFDLDVITPMKKNDVESIQSFQIEISGIQVQSVYGEFSIYNPSTASFVLQEEGIQWSIYSKYFEK
jgi:predicted transcriptional regulator